MEKQESLYHEAAQANKDAAQSQMFGKPCYKINSKAFVCFFQNCMVFKLTGDMHTEAMKLKGSQLFDPSGKGRAMKEWVQVPFEHSKKWKSFAKAAYDYVTPSAPRL